ncbi:hypothetical protein X769_33195 [Mesorhizobium sp. LSJC268A00]|nr:hypothetical protein X769_33195 [Mesorhizobium sp. LSJC268A00]
MFATEVGPRQCPHKKAYFTAALTAMPVEEHVGVHVMSARMKHLHVDWLVASSGEEPVLRAL